MSKLSHSSDYMDEIEEHAPCSNLECWICLAVSADSPSASNGPGCEPSPSVRSSHSSVPFLQDTGPTSPVSQTSESFPPSISRQQELPLMSSAAASHARTSASLETAQELMDRAAAYGRSTPELLARLDPSTSSWKTSQLCLDGDLAEFSETWPRSGMTQNGIAYRLPPLVTPTLGTESGLLPTIGANESKGSQRRRYRGSTEYRGAKMSEGLRSGESDPIYTHPTFAEGAMGFPKDWTLLETPSSRRYQKLSGEQSSPQKLDAYGEEAGKDMPVET